MRGRAVEVVIELLDVLAVVSLLSGEPEEPLLDDRIAAVPEGNGEAEPLPAIGNPGDAILIPAISARARVIVREVIPGRAVGAIVLPDRSPCPFAQVGAPALPVSAPVPRLLQPDLFLGHWLYLLEKFVSAFPNSITWPSGSRARKAREKPSRVSGNVTSPRLTNAMRRRRTHSEARSQSFVNRVVCQWIKSLARSSAGIGRPS